VALKPRTVTTRGRKKSGKSAYGEESSKFNRQSPGAESVLKEKKQRQQDTF
jgi:hypothetical protein